MRSLIWLSKAERVKPINIRLTPIPRGLFFDPNGSELLLSAEEMMREPVPPEAPTRISGSQ